MPKQIPCDSDSLKDRGAWLAIAYMKATKGDSNIFFENFISQELSKQLQFEIRLEMTLYCLSKGHGFIEKCLKDQFKNLSKERILEIAKIIIDAALLTIRTLVPAKSDDIIGFYSSYINCNDKFSFFWKRILERGIIVTRSSHDIFMFDQTVLHGTSLTLALDALSVTQEQINGDHASFFDGIK